jgi:hypothetical protein
MKEYEIWYDGVHPIREHLTKNNKILTFERKGDAKVWIIQNIESAQRKKYKIREAL